jgi:hypothetical protein
MLPRIMPAPQTLLKPSRPTRMPSIPASVVGVSNGTHVTSLNFFPNIIHPIDELPAFAFRMVQIKHRRDKIPGLPRSTGDNDKAISSSIDNGAAEAQQQPCQLRKRESKLTQVTRAVTNKFAPEPHIPTQNLSPLNLLSVVSCCLTIGLLIWAALIQDGTACVALGSISLASCIVGYASWWSPILRRRAFSGHVPAGDVVVRTREGAFIVVKCDEDVARELYTGTEECHYWTTTKTYRVLVGFGTFLLMISVVLLGNCDFPMQAAVGGSYIALNGAFWLVSLMNKEWFWDLSIYEYNDITPPDAINADQTLTGADDDEERIASYTRTMWYAIRETEGETSWVTKSDGAPKTKEWDSWIREAQKAAANKDRLWKAVQRRGVIIGQSDPAIDASRGTHRTDSDRAEQAAPATQIPPPATR